MTEGLHETAACMLVVQSSRRAIRAVSQRNAPVYHTRGWDADVYPVCGVVETRSHGKGTQFPGAGQ